MAPTLVKDRSQHLRRRMHKVDRESGRVNEDVTGLGAKSGMDQCLLWQLEKRIDGLMSELSDICCGILLLDHGSEEFLDQGSTLNKVFYALDLKVKLLLHEQMASGKLIRGISTGAKLPKISIPMFDGDIMNWSSFWEQSDVSIHKKELFGMLKSLST